MPVRALGVLLFLPVPLVLWLFTKAPIGAVPSLLLGTAVMATHRFYARPFSLGRADHRCLWCGRSIDDGSALDVEEPPGRTRWRACSDRHKARLVRTLATADRWRVALRIGILGGLTVLLTVGLAAASDAAGPFSYADAAAVFKVAVALVVLPFGWLAASRRDRVPQPLRVPFPLHIQALIGTCAVLWLFRVVGLVWLVQGMLHGVERLG